MVDSQTKLPAEVADESHEVVEKDESLGSFFEDFLDKESLFLNKNVLMMRYLPNNIPHREKQIKQLSLILAPSLRLEKPSNTFLYGKTGTGKTLCATYVVNKLGETAQNRNIPFKAISLNCKLKKAADTEYRVIAHLARELGADVPMTGLPTSEVYKLFLKKLDTKQIVLIVLDEIDQLIKKAGDGILYTLTRMNSDLKNAQVAVIGISNDVRFMDNIDPRVKSSLGEEEMVFTPYNALELKDILEKRAKAAFRGDTIESGVLAKCAAFAAREHGDARRALDLLRVSGELAEREGKKSISSKHIDLADTKIERNKVVEVLQGQPKQSQIVMFAIFLLSEEKEGYLETGEVFDKYKELCKETHNNVLTQRRVSDLITELDLLGMITAKTISKGRYGRTKEISLAVQPDIYLQLKEIVHASIYS